METIWKVTTLCVGLLFLELCNGLPINLENSMTDSRTQLLTGLVGILLTVCLVVLLTGCICCQRRNGFKEFRDSPVVVSVASDLDHGHVNPISNGEFTIFTPLSPPHHNNNVFLANEQIINQNNQEYCTPEDNSIRPWFGNEEKDFPRSRLKYIKELGKGWFGRVVQGVAQGILSDDEQSWTPVVVRILEATASSQEKAVFLHDAIIYRCQPHPNILQLLGRCLDAVPFLLLQEFCPQGDLKAYLRQNQNDSRKLLATEYPLLWCYEVTSALKHLHENRLTHPDLAARNCLVSSDLHVKLGDYGLSVAKYPQDYYQGAPGVPVRWCAPESLVYTSTTIQPKKVTTEANIWSLGVTMWEICECGAQPYEGLTDDDVISQVLGQPKLRLNRPTHSTMYTDYIFRLMQLCWSTAESRPAIAQIDLMLADLQEVYKNTKEAPQSLGSLVDDFDRRWETLKPNNIVKTDNQIQEVNDQEKESVADNDSEVSHYLNNKELSPSLNNLLEDTAENATQIESWLEKDINKAKNEEKAHSPKPKEKLKVEFKLGPMHKMARSVEVLNTFENDSLMDSMQFAQRTSSESETEDENWKKKIERGAYSEKVRQKSRSVTDLMVLTHIDCSESDSETPLPSLDYRINYKNVRYALKQNLENVSLMFGSEGNLLSVHDTFQEELKKLQEERRDSLLFVPENISQNELEANNETNDKDEAGTSNQKFLDKKILEELNSPSEIKPANQVFNVFNVTVDHKFTPLHFANSSDSLTNLQSPKKENCSFESTPKHFFQVPTLVDLIQNNMDLLDYIIAKYDPDPQEANEESCQKSPEQISGETPTNNDILVAETDASVILHNSVTSENFVNILQTTQSFLENEKRHYNTPENKTKHEFDLNESVQPNSLTHSLVFTSSPFVRKNISAENELFSLNVCKDEEISPIQNENARNLTYSLETWDNFLGKTLEEQSQEDCFSSFNSEPQSILFVDNELNGGEDNGSVLDESDKNESEENTAEKTFNVLNDTFVIENGSNEGNSSKVHDNYVVEESAENGEQKCKGTWEAGEGWFLHPQSNEDVSGQMEVTQTPDSESYVGFSVDYEVIAAIRNELLQKLPHAQGSSTENVEENEEWDNNERSEVFVKYNVYNTSLSPIQEETFSDSFSKQSTPSESVSGDESDWSEEGNQNLPLDVVMDTFENPVREEPQNRHTPSQDSCCSNDTLFNLEELTNVINECEREDVEAKLEELVESLLPGENLINLVPDASDKTLQKPSEQMKEFNGVIELIDVPEEVTVTTENAAQLNSSDLPAKDKQCTRFDYLLNFLEHERQFAIEESSTQKDVENSSESTLSCNFLSKTIAPLPSPENIPWKQLPFSKLTYKEVVTNCENFQDKQIFPEKMNEEKYTQKLKHKINEEDYVDINNLENEKLSIEFSTLDQDETPNIMDAGDKRYGNSNWEMNDEINVLGDIRFTGPCDTQLMSTSFSESNDLGEEQGWDSGSDTRSSSSGEFIWKEGEHEESVKALHAASFDVNNEEVGRMEDIREEDMTESSGSDGEADSPEFVPSAWDKYAIPIKSALRSPEKSNREKKSKGVWFKKQKYHCVYEYPREPESPTIQSYDLWKSAPVYNSLDWDLDADTYITPINGEENNIKQFNDLYKLRTIPDYNMDPSLDDFYISSSSKPFDMLSGLTSQFFPGQNNNEWTDLTKQATENLTPDSGVDDTTPAEPDDTPRTPKPLKLLAAAAAKQPQANDTKGSDVLGGLRHTRNKLKLDLPPSPSAFTSSKVFSIETASDSTISREVPAFTTFGKSRFSVQHVDTPEDQKENVKNVSFEALPYRPMQTVFVKDCCKADHDKNKVEVVTGEASLLDSADEDSGIESSTFERKKNEIDLVE